MTFVRQAIFIDLFVIGFSVTTSEVSYAYFALWFILEINILNEASGNEIKPGEF